LILTAAATGPDFAQAKLLAMICRPITMCTTILQAIACKTGIPLSPKEFAERHNRSHLQIFNLPQWGLAAHGPPERHTARSKRGKKANDRPPKPPVRLLHPSICSTRGRRPPDSGASFINVTNCRSHISQLLGHAKRHIRAQLLKTYSQEPFHAEMHNDHVTHRGITKRALDIDVYHSKAVVPLWDLGAHFACLSALRPLML
jgi:hypothetical protein